MTQNVSPAMPNELMRDFFASLGFTRVRTDRKEADQLLELLVSGLNNVTPQDAQQQQTARELSQRLEQLKIGELPQSLPAVPRVELVQVDPDDEAQLMTQIQSSRARIMREIDEENQRLTGT